MAKLKTIYETAEEIPEGFADLFTERNGKFELTGIENVKTQGDVDRVAEALRKEKADHKATKESLVKFHGIDPETVNAQLEELESTKTQLETLTKGGALDEAKLEPIIEARVKRALGPVEREKTQLTRALEVSKNETVAARTEVDKLSGVLQSGTIERAIRDAAIAAKVISPAIEDAVMQGLSVLTAAEDGAIVTKDNVAGVTPGISAADWLKDMQDKRPHWWPVSQGGGSRGGSGGAVNRADNPWTKEGWNMTKQGQTVKTLGEAKAKAMAESVGSYIGATSAAKV
jgi:hypothetical protein